MPTGEITLDVAGEARALSGILALARTRRAALEIHDPSRLFVAARTPAQLASFATGASTDALLAVKLLRGTDVLLPSSADELAKLGADLAGAATTHEIRTAATELGSITDVLLNHRLPMSAPHSAAVEARFDHLVRSGGVLDAAHKDELALLALEAGVAKRHGLTPKIVRDVQGDVSHVLRYSPNEQVQRVRDLWAAQLDHAPDEIVDEVRGLVRDYGITAETAGRLRTLAMDAGAAQKLRLPRTVVGIGQAEDVLGKVAAGGILEPLDELARWRLERLWQRSLDVGTPVMDDVLPELRRALDAPITDAGQSRELLHLVGDLQTSRKLGLMGGSFALDEILGALVGHGSGTGDVAAAEFARWRLLVRLDDAVADRVAREAVDALRSPVGDTAPAVQLVRAEPSLRLRVEAGERLGVLGASTPRSFPEVTPWLDEVDASVAAQQANIPPTLLDDIDRLRGRVRGFLDGNRPDDKPVGYGHHPDYAEVGRLGEQLRLADLLVGAEARTPTAKLADSLPW